MIFSTKPSPHIILMIGDDGVLCVPHHIPNAPALFFAAHTDKKGTAAIMDVIDRYPTAKIILFADMLAQDFRRETLPKLHFLDRVKLIKRRLQQAFPQARLTMHLNLKPGSTQILMAGLHDSAPVFGWMERLKHRLPRLGLVPIEGASILNRLLPDAVNDWAMMISRQITGGFRQIVTHKGELIFTRLTPPLPADADAVTLAEMIQRDIRASLGYLGRLGLTDAAQLRVILLLHETTHEALSEINLPVHSVTLLSPRKVARGLRLGFALHEDEPYGDLLFAGAMVQKNKLRLAFMLPETRIMANHATISFWGLRVASFCLLLALAHNFWQAGDMIDNMLTSSHETAALAKLKNQLRREREAAAPVTEPLGRLRQALERQRLFAKPTPQPWVLLNDLQKGLGDQTRLVKTDWQNHDKNETMQIALRLTRNPSADENPQQIVSEFQSITQSLTMALPDTRITVLHYPFASLPQDILSNNVASTSPDKTDIQAELMLQRNIP